MTDKEWLKEYRSISDSFMQYGWFVAPYMMGSEFDAVKKMAEELDRNPPQSERDRRDVEDRIYGVLCEPVFHPNYRAKATWEGHLIDHIKEYNHLFEMAMFSYYKREYAQSVHLLLSSLEGILLSYYGWKPGVAPKGKPDIKKKLIAKVKDARPIDARHELFRNTLTQFLEKWVYEDTDKWDNRLSVLNRHYVLHGMDTGNFYRPQDLHRLILAFDLIREFLRYPKGPFPVFVPSPGDYKFFDERKDYYTALAEGNLTIAETWERERNLLKQHKNYEEPAHDPNYEESLLLSQISFLEIFSLFKPKGLNKPHLQSEQ